MYLCFTTIVSFLICGSVFADTCSIERYDDLKKIRVFLSQNNLVLATLDAQILIDDPNWHYDFRNGNQKYPL